MAAVEHRCDADVSANQADCRRSHGPGTSAVFSTVDGHWGTDGTNTVRTEALSDGVFAIAMTLLILDVRAPDHTAGELLAALVHQWPAYLGFLASFLYIAVIWRNHHAAFWRIDTIDRVLSWTNTGILLGAVLLPFPTAVLADAFREGNTNDERTAVVLYTAVAIFMSAMWMAFFWLLDRRIPMSDTADVMSWKAQARRPIVGISGYVIGASLGLAAHPALGLIILAIPIYYAVTSEGLHRYRSNPNPHTTQQAEPPRLGRDEPGSRT